MKNAQRIHSKRSNSGTLPQPQTTPTQTDPHAQWESLEEQLDAFLARANLTYEPRDLVKKQKMARWLAKWSAVLCNSSGIKPEDMESCGNLIQRSYWFKVGMSKSQVAVIRRLAANYGFKDSPVATMARQLIAMAIISLPTIERELHAVFNYCEAEGIWNKESYLEARAEKTLESLKVS